MHILFHKLVALLSFTITSSAHVRYKFFLCIISINDNSQFIVLQESNDVRAYEACVLAKLYFACHLRTRLHHLMTPLGSLPGSKKEQSSISTLSSSNPETPNALPATAKWRVTPGNTPSPPFLPYDHFLWLCPCPNYQGFGGF